jgi:hypothetical protein
MVFYILAGAATAVKRAGTTGIIRSSRPKVASSKDACPKFFGAFPERFISYRMK